MPSNRGGSLKIPRISPFFISQLGIIPVILPLRFVVAEISYALQVGLDVEFRVPELCR
jgi:hypothetical protein